MSRNNHPENIFLRFFFDELPDNPAKADSFRSQIYGLQSLLEFKQANLKIRPRDIIDVDSRDHVLLQCLDIILGSMAFILNDKNKYLPAGKKRRGKRTIAKEKLYKHINKKICEISFSG